jgi:hypothetical protein
MRRYGPAVSTALRKSRAAPIWEQGVRVKFHYTQPRFAESILAEQMFRVSSKPGRAGPGLYVTTVQPRAMPDDKLLNLLFARGRPVLFIEGVVVLRDDALSWERYSHRKYLHSTEPGETLDVSLALAGIGTRHLGHWLWSEGIYAPA